MSKTPHIQEICSGMLDVQHAESWDYERQIFWKEYERGKRDIRHQKQEKHTVFPCHIQLIPPEDKHCVYLHTNTCTLQPPSFLAPLLLPTAQICVVSIYNSHYGGVRFGAEASEWLSCLSGSIPNLLYCSSPKAVPFQTETLACTPLVVPPTSQHQPFSHSSWRCLFWKDTFIS